MRHIISWGVKRAKGRLKGMPREKLGVFSKKRAFTLVELLIAVIIIGILAGMMLMSAGSATDSAKAARIISDLRNMKAAALMYWADNRSWPRWFYAGEAYHDSYGKALPSKYSDLTKQGDGYILVAMQGKQDSTVYAAADVSKLDPGVRKVLEKKSKESSLYGGNLADMPNLTLEGVVASPYQAGHEAVITIISK